MASLEETHARRVTELNGSLETFRMDSQNQLEAAKKMGEEQAAAAAATAKSQAEEEAGQHMEWVLSSHSSAKVC